MSLRPYRGRLPQLAARVYVDEAAVVIGDVVLGEDSSVWPCAVVRGDVSPIRIGARSSVQDGVVLHVTHDGPYTPGGRGLAIGDDVTIGHGAVLHACTVGNACLIGMGATVLDGARIGDRCIVGANALVTQRFVAPPGSMILGAPAKVVRPLTEAEQAGLRRWAEKYVEVAAAHAAKK